MNTGRTLFQVIDEVVALIRADPRLADALDSYPRDGSDSEVIGARWLSRKNAYEITLRFDAETFDRDLIPGAARVS